MNSSTFLAVFPRQLRFWSFHCCLNSLPSLGIALFFLGLWKRPEAVVAMFAAIFVFVMLYATVTSCFRPLSEKGHVISRSIALGAKIRAWISGISVFAICIGGVMLTPDFWSGFVSAGLYAQGAGYFGATGHLIENSERAGFFEIFATTVLEGFIISIFLLVISFFSVIIIQSKERRKFLRSADFRGESAR